MGVRYRTYYKGKLIVLTEEEHAWLLKRFYYGNAERRSNPREFRIHVFCPLCFKYPNCCGCTFNKFKGDDRNKKMSGCVVVLRSLGLAENILLGKLLVSWHALFDAEAKVELDKIRDLLLSMKRVET